MSGHYSQGKRQRDADKAAKKREKAERRRMRRVQGPQEPEIVSAEDIVGSLPSVSQAMRSIEDRGTQQRSAATIPCRLFVGGLSWDSTVESLTQRFSEFGEVTEAVIVTDRDTGRSRGFGFVVMADRKDAPAAIDGMNGAELDGRTLVVNVATARSR